MSNSAVKEKRYPFMILDVSGSASSDVEGYLRTPEGREDLKTFGRIRVHGKSAKFVKTQPFTTTTKGKTLKRKIIANHPAGKQSQPKTIAQAKNG